MTPIYVQLVAHTAETCLIHRPEQDLHPEGPKGSHRESVGQSAMRGAHGLIVVALSFQSLGPIAMPLVEHPQ